MCDSQDLQLEEVELGTEDMLVDLGNRYAQILDLEEDLKSRKESLRDEVRIALSGREKVHVPGFSFTQKPRTTRRLNTSRLRKVMGDDLDQYYDETESDPVLTIKRRST